MSKNLQWVGLVMMGGVTLVLVWLCSWYLFSESKGVTEAPVVLQESEAKEDVVHSDWTDVPEALLVEDVVLSPGVSFPVFSASRMQDTKIVERINETLREKVLEGETTVTWGELKKETPTVNPAALSYQVSYPVPGALLVSFTEESCGAYCSNFVVQYLFALETGQLLTLADFYTPAGLAVIRREMVQQKTDTIETFVAHAKQILTTTSNSEDRERLEIQIDHYPNCIYDYDGYDPLENTRWSLNATSTTFVTEACFPHGARYADDLGHFEYIKDHVVFEPYLTSLGRDMLVRR